MARIFSDASRRSWASRLGALIIAQQMPPQGHLGGVHRDVKWAQTLLGEPDPVLLGQVSEVTKLPKRKL